MKKQRICLRTSSSALEEHSWESEQLLRIGRMPELDVVLCEGSISRVHAEVASAGQAWEVRDLGSTNGTFLNGVRIGQASQKLHEGDILQCGNVVMIVTFVEEDALSIDEAADDAFQVTQTVRHCWADVLQVATSEKLRQPAAAKQLLTLLQIGRDLGRVDSLDAYLESVLWKVAEVLDAQHGAVLLADAPNEAPTLRAHLTSGSPLEQERWLHKEQLRQALARDESLLAQNLAGDHPQAMVQGRGGARSVIFALLRSPHKSLGVLCLARGFDQEPFDEDDLSLTDALALSISASIDSVEHLLSSKRHLLVQTLTTLAQMVEMRDESTASHMQRVTNFALLLAEELKLSSKDCHYLQIGTPLLDIGKIGINVEALRKPGPLTPDEVKHVQSHVLKSAALFETIPDLAPLLPIVRSHHERWDGTGYPDKLAGKQIPLLARIVALADAFDAMTTDRPHQPALPLQDAFAEVERRSGTQFDPNCVRAFLALRPRIEALLHQRDSFSDTMSLLDIQEAWQQVNLHAGAKELSTKTKAVPCTPGRRT